MCLSLGNQTHSNLAIIYKEEADIRRQVLY